MARLVPVSRLAAVFRLEEFAQRFDALDDHQEVVAAEREHRIDQIMPRSLILEMHLEPIGEEVEKIEAVLPDLSSAPRDTLVSDRGALSRKICKRVVNSKRLRVEEIDKSNLEVVLQHDADDAEGGAAQRVRILGPGRLLVDRPKAHQHVELVGKRDGDGNGITGHIVRRTDRLVMRGNGVGDLGVLLLLERVVAAHHPLQLGELADHAADQIGFGQHGHPLGVIGSGSDQRRDLPRKHARALDAVILLPSFS